MCVCVSRPVRVCIVCLLIIPTLCADAIVFGGARDSDIWPFLNASIWMRCPCIAVLCDLLRNQYERNRSGCLSRASATFDSVIAWLWEVAGRSSTSLYIGTFERKLAFCYESTAIQPSQRPVCASIEISTHRIYNPRVFLQSPNINRGLSEWNTNNSYKTKGQATMKRPTKKKQQFKPLSRFSLWQSAMFSVFIQ